MNESQQYAWAHFMTAAFARHPSAPAAARIADGMLEEFNARFGPCPLCQGRGHVPGANEDCAQCHGSGDVRPR